MSEITREDLQNLMEPILKMIGDKTLDTDLEIELNSKFPSSSPEFHAIETACHAAIEAGWMCKYEAEGLRYGRVIKPVEELNRFSVDVVDMNDTRGPYHRHPQGEIDMIMPMDENANFDGTGAGWKVYAANTAHYPTVTGGRALILYLLPDGEIEFTGK
jgi:hypothetical protein